MVTNQTREPFERLSHDYVVGQRRKGVKDIEIFNSYTREEIVEWFRRGMTGYFGEKTMWGFSPVEYEFFHHGDWAVSDGLLRIYNNEQLAPESRKYFADAVLDLLVATPADEKNLLQFGELCHMVMNIRPMEVLRLVPSLVRGDNDEAYRERYLGLCDLVSNLLDMAPKTSVRVLQRLVRKKNFQPERVGVMLVRLVEVDPKGLLDHLKALSSTARRMSTDVIKAQSRWLGRDLIKLLGIGVLRSALVAPEWAWLRKSVEAAKGKHKKRAA